MRKAAVVAFVLVSAPAAAEPQWFPSLDNRIFRSGTVDLRATYAAYSDRTPTGREDGGFYGDGGDGPGGRWGGNPRVQYCCGVYGLMQAMMQGGGSNNVGLGSISDSRAGAAGVRGY